MAAITTTTNFEINTSIPISSRCENRMFLTSTVEDVIPNFLEEFDEQMSILDRSFNMLESKVPENKNKHWKKCIDFCNKNDSPTDLVMNICKEFPNLEIFLVFYNIECEFYGELHYQYESHHVEGDYDIEDDDLTYYNEKDLPCLTETEVKNAICVRATEKFAEFLFQNGLSFSGYVDFEPEDKV